MPYVKRNQQGAIVAVHDTQIDDSYQWIEASDLKVTAQAKEALTGTDQEMVRVVEDLIDLLMEKQIFVFTELPEAVQAKLNSRKRLREDINLLAILVNDDAIF
ncbi:MAG: hypothetical protein IBX55_20220 [Methyloprofundus sp.]|nr:hypothetical protein [Methyloprofundus sp.]MBW6452763.1 hypothetical protein [Methyloprofundus sp.]